MKSLILAISASALIAGAAGSAAYAAPDHNGYNNGAHGAQHAGWGRDSGAGHHWQQGQRMGYNDWANAQPVDYRSHHLRQPPRGYEWRQSNGQYVLAAAATGLIASIMLSQ
ncbi:MAG: RcnB family protein [Caulobacteraceae bacterium]